MGEEFILKAKKYVEDSGDSKFKFSGFGVIKLNPDKSKHLETATITING